MNDDGAIGSQVCGGGGGGGVELSQRRRWTSACSQRPVSSQRQPASHCFSLQSAVDPLHLHNLVSRGGLALTVSSIISCHREGEGDFFNFSMHFTVRVKHHKAGVLESYEKSTAAASFSMRTYVLTQLVSVTPTTEQTLFLNMEGQNNNIFVPFLQVS